MSHYKNNQKYKEKLQYKRDKTDIFEKIVCYFAKINCKKKNPIDYEKFRRYPAQSLMEKKRELVFDFIDKATRITILYTFISVFIKSMTLTLFFITFYGIAIVYISKNFIKEARKIDQGIDGELYVAQILNKIAIEEAKNQTKIMIFHDIVNSEKSYNIDHVIVSSKGVFAIDTKAHSLAHSKEDKTVTIKKSYIQKGKFKIDIEVESLIKAQSKWLEKELGVEVKPILAYIGWFINNKEYNEIDSVKIINISNIKFLLNDFKKLPSIYNQETYNQIVKKLHKLSRQEDRSIHFCCS